MKLIIDIPEDVYTRLFDNGIQDNEIATDDICEMARALRLGTPIPDNATVCNIDAIKHEIKSMLPEYGDGSGWEESKKITLINVLKTIDEHIKGEKR